MVGRTKPIAAPKNVEYDLETEIANLKKRNVALAKALAEFRTKAREMESERNILHGNNINLINEIRQLRTRTMNGGRVIISMLVKASEEVTNLMTNRNISSDATINENVSNIENQDSTMQSNSETWSSSKLNKTQAVKPMVSGHVICSPKIYLRRVPTEDLLATNIHEIEVSNNTHRPSISLNNSLINYDEAEASTSGLNRSNPNIVPDSIMNLYENENLESPNNSTNSTELNGTQHNSKLSTVLELSEDISVSNNKSQNSTLLSGVFQGTTNVNVYLNRDEVSHLNSLPSTSQSSMTENTTILSTAQLNESSENIENEEQDRFVSKRGRSKQSRKSDGSSTELSKRLKSKSSSINRSSISATNNHSTRSRNSTTTSNTSTRSAVSGRSRISRSITASLTDISPTNNTLTEPVSSSGTNNLSSADEESYDPLEDTTYNSSTYNSSQNGTSSTYSSTPFSKHKSTSYMQLHTKSLPSPISPSFAPRVTTKMMQQIKSKRLQAKSKTPKKQKLLKCSVVLKRLAVPSKRKSTSPRKPRKSTPTKRTTTQNEENGSFDNSSMNSCTDPDSDVSLILSSKRIRKKKLMPDFIATKISKAKIDSPKGRPKRKAQPTNLKERNLNIKMRRA